jgi:hypothetical protein
MKAEPTTSLPWVAPRRLVRHVCRWVAENAAAAKALLGVPRYLRDEFRPNMRRTRPRLLVWKRKWVTIEKWTGPRLEVSVCDGMAEHYGYPRHHVWIVFFWRRVGYATGIEFSVPNTHDQERKSPASDGSN